MGAYHDFNESLAASHKASDLPIWEQIYRRAFPGFLAMVDHRADGEHQRAGIDRSVILANSKQILIDEKIRYKPYTDILLEYVSIDRTGAPGWVCKPQRADYIAYAVAPLGVCYLLPVIQLQLAWMQKGDCWIASYGTRKSANNGYNTLNCPVPVKELYPVIGAALRVKFDVDGEANDSEQSLKINVLHPAQIIIPTIPMPSYKQPPLFS